jgi:hypothetical protein
MRTSSAIKVLGCLQGSAAVYQLVADPVIELTRFGIRNALMDDQRHLFPVHGCNGHAAVRTHTTMLPAVCRDIVGRFARLSLHEKGSTECERRFAVINTNDASLKGAVVVMKLTIFEIERPVSSKVGALLRSGRNSACQCDDERGSKQG